LARTWRQNSASSYPEAALLFAQLRREQDCAVIDRAVYDGDLAASTTLRVA
jgi:hypothetical protein